jgi:hypothetical protein
MHASLVALAAVIFAATAPEALVFAAACRHRLLLLLFRQLSSSEEVLTVRFYPGDCPISESVSSGVRASVDEVKRPREIEV